MTGDNRKKGKMIAIVFIVLLVFIKTLLRPFGILDELWNYNLCRGVSMGYVPYRDFGMVMMPLYTMLFALPLIICRKLVVYRIASAVFLAALVIYFRDLTAKQTDDLWGTAAAFIFVTFMDISTYNSLLFLLAMICYSILIGEMTRKRAFVLGIVCALSIMGRQTSGVFLALACIGIFSASAELRKHVAYAAAGGTMILMIFAGWLIGTSSWDQFWDHCLFALVSSGDKNSAFYVTSVPVLILSAAGISADIMLWRKKHSRVDICHLIVGLVIASMGIPVVDLMHLFYAGMWFVIPLIKLIILSGSSVRSGIVKLIPVLSAAVTMILVLHDISGCVLDNRFDELLLIPTDKSFTDTYADINTVNESYEAQGKRVIFFSCSCCISSILEERFDPPYDLFLTGNMGTKEPLSYAVEACSDPDCIILIPNDYQTENWENPKGISQYVTSHCEPVDSYGRFVWYRPAA